MNNILLKMLQFSWINRRICKHCRNINNNWNIINFGTCYTIFDASEKCQYINQYINVKYNRRSPQNKRAD